MTDRELLELAAKAAGIEVYWEEDVPNEVTYYGNTKTWACWNPLTDDGDALRLAVKLRLQLDTDLGVTRTAVADCRYAAARCLELANDDPYAATRRAIVRAAAEIGKAKA